MPATSPIRQDRYRRHATAPRAIAAARAATTRPSRAAAAASPRGPLDRVSRTRRCLRAARLVGSRDEAEQDPARVSRGDRVVGAGLRPGSVLQSDPSLAHDCQL